MDIWPDRKPTPVLMLAEDAVRGGTVDLHWVLAELSDRARDAIDRRTPLVVLTIVAGPTPKPRRDLSPRVVTLAPLERDMLGPLFSWAYPEQDTAPARAMLPAGLVLSRLGPDALMLALRTRDPADAVRALGAALTPTRAEGLGLEAFPLPDAVRAPVMQVVRDLRDWHAGQLAWRDVTRGVLVMGPPGSAKTALARMIAEEAGVRWWRVRWRSGRRRVRAAFAMDAE
ncbi:ATP-binding protein [Roseicyclus sp.]